MGNFIFIIPEDWTQISSQAIGEIGSPITDWVNINDMNSLTEALRLHNEIPQDMTVWEAKFFNGEVLAVRIG